MIETGPLTDAIDEPVDRILGLLSSRPRPTRIVVQMDVATPGSATGDATFSRLTLFAALCDRLVRSFDVPLLTFMREEAPAEEGGDEELGGPVRVPALEVPGFLTVPSFLLDRTMLITFLDAAPQARRPVSALAAQATMLTRLNPAASVLDLACEAHRVARSDALLAVLTDENGDSHWVVSDDDLQLETTLARAAGLDPERWPELERIRQRFSTGSASTDGLAIRFRQPRRSRLGAARTCCAARTRRVAYYGVFAFSSVRRVLPRVASAVRRRIQG